MLSKMDWYTSNQHELMMFPVVNERTVVQFGIQRMNRNFVLCSTPSIGDERAGISHVGIVDCYLALHTVRL